MKKSVYISEKSSTRWLMPLLFTELAGIIAGSFIALHFRNSEIFQEYICPEIFGGTALEIFAGTLITSAIFLVLSFFFGLCTFGQPFGIALLLCLGAECSCSAALLYAERGISGIPAVLMMYLPKTAALSAVGILSVREVIRTSTGLLKCLISSEEPPCLKSYCIRYAVLFAAVLLLSAVEALLSCFFGIG
ncbi:MAG: hypothetical protein IJX61_00450 [Ruminococcus sp.]|nr:hypothetical protein [Ruminococcus sp.]